MSKNQDAALLSVVPDSERLTTSPGRVFHAVLVPGRWLTAVLALILFNLAWGGAQSDPTLPSPAWLDAQPNVQGAATPEVHVAPPGMQLILIGRSRKFAIIDGKVVKPGDTYNGSKVLNIKSDEVVVQDESKSLKLTPAVEKKVAASARLKKIEGAAPKSNVLLNSDGGVR